MRLPECGEEVPRYVGRVDGGEATARMHAEAVSDAVGCVSRTVPDAIEAFR